MASGFRSVEECIICTDDLGLPGRPAAQLPCGHIFCHQCCEEWIRNQQKAGCGICPTCRITFKPSKVRPLVPWKGGLTLKQTSPEESHLIRELEGVRSERIAYEKRAVAVDKAYEYAKRQRQASETAAAAAEARAAIALPTTTLASVPAASSSLPSATVPVDAQAPAPLPTASDAAIGSVGSTSTVTEAQRQRAAAMKATALARLEVRPPAASLLRVTAATSNAAFAPAAGSATMASTMTEEQRQRAAAQKAAALARLERTRTEREAQKLTAASKASEPGLADQFPDILGT